ncbi:MAG: glutamate 2,3-aminomutase [Bacillota bacterium]
MLQLDTRLSISLSRASELKDTIQDYLKIKDHIPTGFTTFEQFLQQKERILTAFQASEHNWQDWKWQISNRITTAEQLAQFIPLSEKQIVDLNTIGKRFRWAISPYYLAVMDWNNPDDPVRLQAIPQIKELQDEKGELDPMGEEYSSPAPGITRRYPDRLIINVTNQCAMYCRHCQRRRNIGTIDRHLALDQLDQALDYIRKNPEIRDVLITGGDALLLSDSRLDWLLTELDRIPHVEIKRIGTRAPVTLPQRITPELAAILEKHPPIYINTQFNHPREVTPEAKQAIDRLIKAGVVLGNQAVLLRGINDNPHVMKKLNQELLKVRIRPYYIFHPKKVLGTAHFSVPITTGIKIIDQLRGRTSGLAVPQYIVNAPGGLGKIPVSPDYAKVIAKDHAILRTWENKLIKIEF